MIDYAIIIKCKYKPIKAFVQSILKIRQTEEIFSNYNYQIQVTTVKYAEECHRNVD